LFDPDDYVEIGLPAANVTYRGPSIPIEINRSSINVFCVFMVHLTMLSGILDYIALNGNSESEYILEKT
jgi:hypothetical protein